ncbi:MAG: hypothetical protein KC933_20590 [Myxococcales bacterium]|nr:hypothetical protein [Myxococcales bacterium]MCB9647993.1 hypothetical protein [Deltaproteobacteria bacterium]
MTGSLHFSDPMSCGGCHPDHLREWRGSAMHYAAVSPVFNAFELTIRELSEGLVASDGEQKNFCSKCHSPPAHLNDELPPLGGPAARDTMSPVSLEGLSCDFCHSVQGPDDEASFTHDGIGNLALSYSPALTKRGPYDDVNPGQAHGAEGLAYLKSSEFCGACHDVRFPKPDLVTGEPFQRVENLFTEWAVSAYAFNVNRYGRPISCQDCHMSLYPTTEPGVYPETPIALGDGLPARRHAVHAFTAVSTPLIDDPRFPNVSSPEVDRFGFPVGQHERRTAMLRAACTLALKVPERLDAGAEVLPVDVTVTNVGAGHRVPAGFSQERQVWLHIEVRDDAGLLYESGYLRDEAHPETGELVPDGRLDDEDLEDVHRVVDPATLADETTPGPDVDLVNFQNAFLQKVEGGWRPVINPLAADAIDHRPSLVPGVPRVVRYAVPLTRPVEGPVRASVRLRYRALPPELLRALAARHPDLVTEAIIDNNRIVDMAEAEAVVPR